MSEIIGPPEHAWASAAESLEGFQGFRRCFPQCEVNLKKKKKRGFQVKGPTDQLGGACALALDIFTGHRRVLGLFGHYCVSLLLTRMFFVSVYRCGLM